MNKNILTIDVIDRAAELIFAIGGLAAVFIDTGTLCRQITTDSPAPRDSDLSLYKHLQDYSISARELFRLASDSEPYLKLQERVSGVSHVWVAPIGLDSSHGAVAWMALVSDQTKELRTEQCRAITLCKQMMEVSCAPRDTYFYDAPEMFCISNHLGKFVDYNQFFLQILGYETEDLDGSDVFSIVHPNDHESTREAVRGLIETGKIRNFRNRCRRKDGTYRLLEWSSRTDSQQGLIFSSARDVTEQAASEQAIKDSNTMLTQVSQALSEYIRSETAQNPFEVMLTHLLQISSSEYGFIGEILHHENGEPFLKTHALTNIAWNETTRKLYDDSSKTGLTFTNLQSLFGHVMTSGKPVISNQPATDPRRAGLPPGHPPLNAFMGLPISSGKELIGMIGIANRPGGYDEQVSQHLDLLIATSANLILAFRAEHGRHRAQQQVVKREETLRALVDNAADGIVQLSSEGLIERSNLAMQSRFGKDAVQLNGLHLKQLIAPSSQADFERILKSVDTDSFGHQAANVELLALDAGGTQFPIDFKISHMQFSDESKFVAIVRDISEWKENQQALVEARRQAEAANKAKGEFLANMSHEVRTPINGVIGMTELAMETKLDAEQREYLDAINESAQSLLRVVNDILDFSKIDAGQLSVEQVPFEIHKSLGFIAREFQLRAEHKGLRFTLDIDKKIPQVLVGDVLRLRQILINLISNAIKFTDSGYVKAELKLQAFKDNVVAVDFAVEDSGIGISSEQQKAIFKAFQQADTSITRRYGGSGLGLVISSNLIQLMGGKIHLSSTPGKGSRFSFQLLFEPGSAALLKDHLETEAQSRNTSLQSDDSVHSRTLRILLAEDNPINQKLTMTVLGKAGHEVLLANNGVEAVHLAKQQHFDLILMDLQMPELDGLQATAQIREWEAASGRRTPVIAMTAHAVMGYEEICISNGMDAYISKPVSSKALSKIVGSVASDKSQP
jgi:PAS domain S-box-containing protein